MVKLSLHLCTHFKKSTKSTINFLKSNFSWKWIIKHELQMPSLKLMIMSRTVVIYASVNFWSQMFMTPQNLENLNTMDCILQLRTWKIWLKKRINNLFVWVLVKNHRQQHATFTLPAGHPALLPECTELQSNSKDLWTTPGSQQYPLGMTGTIWGLMKKQTHIPFDLIRCWKQIFNSTKSNCLPLFDNKE